MAGMSVQLDDLLLDEPTLDDVAAMHEIYSDPRVWTHLPSGRHATVDTTEQLVQGWVDGWARDGLSVWIVRDAGTGAVLGDVGCSIRRHSFWNLGYRLAHDAHGRGIATRVAQYAVDEAHRIGPALPVVAYLLEHNRASARVAQNVRLTLRFRALDVGNPDPDAIRLVYADRPLSDEQLRAALM